MRRAEGSGLRAWGGLGFVQALGGTVGSDLLAYLQTTRLHTLNTKPETLDPTEVSPERSPNSKGACPNL